MAGKIKKQDVVAVLEGLLIEDGDQADPQWVKDYNLGVLSAIEAIEELF